ncbi:MAG: glycosyltransferase family 2 protein [Acidimicrobiales bacterium]
MTVRPLVSVVIPTRDRRRLVSRALRSALGQQGVEVQVVVVDDASTDGTAGHVRSLGDRRVTVVSQPEARGVAVARNIGLRRATAPWVAFLDDDDVWAPTKLSAQLQVLADNPSARWACTDAVLVDPELRIMGPQAGPQVANLADSLLARNVIPGGASAVMCATDLLDELGGFDVELSSLADWDLWIRLALVSPTVCARAPLVAYRVHPGAMAHDVDRAEADLHHIIGKYRDERAARHVELDDAFWLWYFAQLHLRAGRRWAAARCQSRLAWSHRQHRRWPLVAVGLAWPGVQSVRDRHGGARMPPAWRDATEGWLAPLRAMPDDVDGSDGPPP